MQRLSPPQPELCNWRSRFITPPASLYAKGCNRSEMAASQRVWVALPLYLAIALALCILCLLILSEGVLFFFAEVMQNGGLVFGLVNRIVTSKLFVGVFDRGQRRFNKMN